MTLELKIAHCPGCGKVFQKNWRNLCLNCSSEEDRDLRAMEQVLSINRLLNNDKRS